LEGILIKSKKPKKNANIKNKMEVLMFPVIALRYPKMKFPVVIDAFSKMSSSEKYDAVC